MLSFSGHGAIVGILKVGWKRLFVYDRHGQQWEMNPLCVLDFYVHESRQRMGCGRRLFDFMLKVSGFLLLLYAESKSLSSLTLCCKNVAFFFDFMLKVSGFLLWLYAESKWLSSLTLY